MSDELAAWLRLVMFGVALGLATYGGLAVIASVVEATSN
jgi:hypothetical protein